MHHDENTIPAERIPEINCSISVSLNMHTPVTLLVNKLNKIGIQNITMQKPKLEPSIILTIASVHNERTWELDCALTKMFLQIDSTIQQVKTTIKEYDGEIFIDVWFYQYGTYPALVFSGANMEKIHFLEANISIDPFDCRTD